MANPRKFSEKIALHNQKQAEETAAFEKIMREVSDATNKVISGSRKTRVNTAPMPVENVDSSLKPNQQSLGSFRSGSLPNVAAPQTTVEPENEKPEEATIPPQYVIGGRSGGTSPSRATGRDRGRVSSVGPMRRPADRKHDTSPYGSSIYLSPPPDSNWRRTNSDSALHQSCGEPPMSAPQHHPLAHPHHHPHQNHNRDAGDMSLLTTLGMNCNDRPRSSCDIPRIPNNNNVYGSVYYAGGGAAGGASLSCDMQVPGGSLPDLTALHFPQPQHYLTHLAHRTSPEQPRTPYYPLSPSPGASPGGAESVSPATGGLSPASGSPVGATVPHPLAALHDHRDHRDHALYEAQNHLSVPNTNSYSHHSNKTMSPLDHNWIASSYQSHCSPPSQYSSTSNINIPSPTMVHSPGSPVESTQTDCNNLHQLLQPFEQFTMLDQPTSSYNTTYMNHSSPQQSHAQHTTNTHTYTQAGGGGGGGARGEGRRARDPVAGGGVLPVHAPATPSIPDIILTDYSGELDAGIFGGEEAQLRAGLDLDDLNLLEEPSALLPDSSVEHEFRLDRL